MRTIIFGDVHGCFEELADLLKETRACESDQLVSVGDLFGKGPDSKGVLDWALAAPNLKGVLGNHELRFLEHWRAGRTPDDKAYDADTLRQLGARFEEYMRFLDRWPLAIEERDWLVVHAGFDPALPRRSQAPRVLANLRRLGDGSPWYESYREPRLVAFGHWVRREVLVRDNVVGLDTGCVYGGKLSALILPERRVVSVPARRAYVARESWA